MFLRVVFLFISTQYVLQMNTIDDQSLRKGKKWCLRSNLASVDSSIKLWMVFIFQWVKKIIVFFLYFYLKYTPLRFFLGAFCPIRNIMYLRDRHPVKISKRYLFNHFKWIVVRFVWLYFPDNIRYGLIHSCKD